MDEDRYSVIISSSDRPKINNTSYEVVERKGLGHPDNICDSIAEEISRNYSLYCIKKYGLILRHMVDKITVLGGSSKVSFGHGEMIRPIRILLNGRFTHRFNNEQIDYKQIVRSSVFEYFKKIFPLLDTEKWLEIIDNTHFSQGPGVVYDSKGNSLNERKNFFMVTDEKLAHLHNNNLRSNDTSTCVSYSPLSNLEQIVILIEKTLDSDEFKKEYPYVGTDIKVMGKRVKEEIELTCCIPFIAQYTPNVEFYQERIEWLKKLIIKMINDIYSQYKVKIFLNTRDDIKNQDIYLTAIGSAVESGDEGAVGRGDRANGVISFNRSMSIEAPYGKNPIYHTGKIYTIISSLISEEIYSKLGLENTVYLTSQMGRLIKNPWSAAVIVDGVKEITNKEKEIINSIFKDKLNDHLGATKLLIKKKITLNN
ncbi:MAG: methionine adenosyltransferase [Candidatus Shapirobacteria bacterium]|jgi:S-adenosylmethionine synthetase